MQIKLKAIKDEVLSVGQICQAMNLGETTIRLWLKRVDGTDKPGKKKPV